MAVKKTKKTQSTSIGGGYIAPNAVRLSDKSPCRTGKATLTIPATHKAGMELKLQLATWEKTGANGNTFESIAISLG